MKFKVGDKVVANRNMASEHKLHPDYYPVVGTLGTVTEICSPMSIRVQWERGTTSEQDLWLAYPETLDIVPEPKPDEVATKADMVNAPPHYTDGGIEVIDYIHAKLTPDGYRGFLQGNILKYVSRAGKKIDAQEDLRKARWYLDKLIDSYGDPKVLETISVQEVENELEIRMISPKQIGFIAGLTKELGFDRYDLPDDLSPLPNYKELTEGEATELIDKLLSMKENKKRKY